MRTLLALCVFAVIIPTGFAHDGPHVAVDTRGRDLALSCSGCHGTLGRSAGGIPVLAGLDKTYLVKQMADFKSGQRPATVMHQIAKGFSDEQVGLLADYFASQKN